MSVRSERYAIAVDKARERVRRAAARGDPEATANAQEAYERALRVWGTQKDEDMARYKNPPCACRPDSPGLVRTENPLPLRGKWRLHKSGDRYKLTRVDGVTLMVPKAVVDEYLDSEREARQEWSKASAKFKRKVKQLVESKTKVKAKVKAKKKTPKSVSARKPKTSKPKTSKPKKSLSARKPKTSKPKTSKPKTSLSARKPKTSKPTRTAKPSKAKKPRKSKTKTANFEVCTASDVCTAEDFMRFLQDLPQDELRAVLKE